MPPSPTDAQGRLLLYPPPPRSPLVLSPSDPPLSSSSAPAHATYPRSEMHIDDVGAPLPRRDVLIPPSSPSSSNRLSPADAPQLTSAAHLLASPQRVSAIQPADQNNFTHFLGQDVLPELSAFVAPPPSTVYQPQLHQHVSPSHFTSESPRLPSHPPRPHGQVTHAQHRPRTTHPVFGNTSKLAQHYGIPTRLPPTPRIGINEPSSSSSSHTAFSPHSTARPPRPPVPRFNEQQQHQQQQQTSSTPSSSTSAFIQSYLNMINSKPQDSSSSTVASSFLNESSTMTQSSLNDATAAALFGGAHDYTSPQWTEFLTSPLADEDTPYDGLLDTPAQGSDFLDFLTSPAVVDLGTQGDRSFADLPLFAGTPFLADVHKLSLENTLAPPPSASASSNGASGLPPTPATPATHDFDSLIPLTPETPALDPSSTQDSPFLAGGNHDHYSAASKNRRTTKVPNGTRRNLKATDLIPVEAPTQVRNYLAPSVTSRKALPAVFARKRARSAMDEGEDELDGECGGDGTGALPPNEQGAIAAKRRQNTLAARRSRKRKLEYQQELEEKLEALEKREAMWKDRATSAKRQLMQLGFPEPWSDD